MDANEIQIYVVKIVKSCGQNCLFCVKKYSIHACILVLLFLLYLFPLGLIVLAYSSPIFGLAFLVRRVFVGMDRPKGKNVGPKSKRWKELQSRRSFRSVNRFRAPNQNNRSSSMHDSPGVCQNAKEKITEICSSTSGEDKGFVSSKNFNVGLVDKRTLVEEKPKEIPEVIMESVIGRMGWSSSNASQTLMPVNHYSFDEEYRKCGFDIGKDQIQERLDACEGKEETHENANKGVRWIEDDEKSLMDLGISEVERTKRLEKLMERRSRKLSSFQLRRNGTGNSSCSQISSLHIPKTNPFLAKSSGDPNSAPSYMTKSNPFDLPYDPHEEKPILTGDDFEEEFMGPHQKDPRHERSRLGKFLPPESTNYKNETAFGSDFAIKQLTSGRLGTLRLEKREVDRQPQQDSSIPNDSIDDNHAREEGESSEKVVGVIDVKNEGAGNEAAEKVVGLSDEAARTEATENVVGIVCVPNEGGRTTADTKDQEVDHDVSSDQSSSSSSSSEDEPILRPNKEAILHCLSMSRMRIMSSRNNFQRHAESFDCGPSALFDKTKTDSLFFGGNKRTHYPSTFSVASDMQVEVSELGSPSLTNISSLDDEESVVNSTNQSEMDVNDSNEASLRDIDVVCEQSRFSRQNLDPDPLESTMNPEKTKEQDGHQKDRQLTQDQETEDSVGEATSCSKFRVAEEAPMATSPMCVLQPKLLIAEDIVGDFDGYEVETQSLFPPSPPLEEVDMGRLPISAPPSMASSPKSTSPHELSVDPSSISTRVEVPNQDANERGHNRCQ